MPWIGLAPELTGPDFLLFRRFFSVLNFMIY
jgi:hypothetical protein